MTSLIASQIRGQVRYTTTCYKSNSVSNLLSLMMVFKYFKVEPRFHAIVVT